MQKQKRSAAVFILNLCTFISAAVCLASVSAAYISPQILWMPAFFGLGFFISYPVNFLFFIFQALRKKKMFLLPLIPVLAGAFTFYNSLNITSGASSVKNENELKVMSYNVRLFDLYNWSHNMETRAKIFRMLQNEKPDVICFQEFYSEDKGTFKNVDTLKLLLGLPYVKVSYTNTLKGIYHFGIATFSRYPIIAGGEMQFGKKKTSNNCIYIDIKKGNDTLRVYNAHLESIRFKKEDYMFIENIDEVDEQEDLTGGKKIATRLKRAFEKRAHEADTLATHISNAPYPVIFCGDFNDTPSSYAYNTLRSILHDSFKSGPAGFGTTYNGPFPAFRIDYILHSDDLNSSNFKITKESLSDHFPVSCFIGMK